MIYKYNEQVPAQAISSLRESVGWNRMEKELNNPKLTSYYHIAAYDGDSRTGCLNRDLT